MPAALHRLSFEKPIYEIEEQIAGLEAVLLAVVRVQVDRDEVHRRPDVHRGEPAHEVVPIDV